MAARCFIFFFLLFSLYAEAQQKQEANRRFGHWGQRISYPGIQLNLNGAVPVSKSLSFDNINDGSWVASFNEKKREPYRFTNSGSRVSRIKFKPAYSYFTLPQFNLSQFRPSGRFLAMAFLDTICLGQSVQLTAFGPGKKRFKWQLANGLNAPFDTIPNPVVNPTSTTTYMVVGSSDTDQDTAFVKVTVMPKPTAVTVTGSASICPQVQGVWYKASNPRQQPLVWGVKGGSITNITNDSVAVNWGSTNASAKVWVVPKNYLGCPGDTVFFPVQVNVMLATAKPTGPDSLCHAAATGMRYRIPSTVGSNYTWGVIGGTITRGQGLAAIIVDWNQAGTGKLWVREESQTATSHCFGVSDTLRIQVLPSPGTLSISGPQQVCAFSANQTYSITGIQSGSKVNWNLTGGQISSGQGTNSITVNWQNGKGKIEAQEVNASGCSSAVFPYNVQIESLPVPAITTLTDPAICLSRLARPHTYAVQQVTGASYKWLVSGGSILSGQNSNSVQVKWNAVNSGNKIGVIQTSTSGCSSDTLWFPLRLDATEPELKAVSVKEEDEGQLQVLYDLKNGGNYPFTSLAVQRQVSGKANFQAAAVALLNSGNVAFVNTNAADGNWFRLAGRNMCGDSIFSQSHRPIYLTKSTSNQQDKVSLSWNGYEGWPDKATDYQVWRKTEGRAYELLTSLGSQAKSFESQVTGEGFEQCFKIRAIAADGRESWSNSVCLTFEDAPEFYNLVTPNDDQRNDKFVIGKLQLYPENELAIYNRWGSLIYNSRNYRNEWPAKSVSDGVYYYCFKARGKSYKGWVEVAR